MKIETRINAITQAYRSLIEENRRFVESAAKSGSEGFRNLIEQRSIVCEDLEVLSDELLKATDKVFVDQPFVCKNVIEVVRALPVIAPELNEACDLLKETLRELVASDKGVEQLIDGLRDEVKAELGKIRKGSQSIKGYRQNDNFGSCFINKIK